MISCPIGFFFVKSKGVPATGAISPVGIDGADGTLREFAEVEDPKSGRKMKAYTDLPGVQFYAGNCITEETGKDNAAYGPRTGFCLETQYYPDTIHHANFPSAVFGPDRDYESVTVYRFL